MYREIFGIDNFFAWLYLLSPLIFFAGILIWAIILYFYDIFTEYYLQKKMNHTCPIQKFKNLISKKFHMPRIVKLILWIPIIRLLWEISPLIEQLITRLINKI